MKVTDITGQIIFTAVETEYVIYHKIVFFINSICIGAFCKFQFIVFKAEQDHYLFYLCGCQTVCC